MTNFVLHRTSLSWHRLGFKAYCCSQVFSWVIPSKVSPLLRNNLISTFGLLSLLQFCQFLIF